MPINATSRGLNISNFKALALQQANGLQAAHFLNSIATALGANPKVQIKVDGTIKYQDTISGSLTVTTNYIQLPSSFNEPPEISLTDALSGTCFLEIEKASDTSVALVIPLSLPAADPTDVKLDISAALTAGVAVKTNVLRIYAPVTLDVSSGSGYPAPPTSGITRTIYTVNDAPVTVPTTLMGASMHVHPDAPFGETPWSSYPGASGASNANPPVSVKVLGSHARLGASWAGIVNKGWSYYDQYKAYGAQFGAKVHFVLFQTPNELVKPGYGVTANYFPGLQNGGGDKGNAPPVNGAAKSFIIDLLNHDTTLETVESWNEYELAPAGYWQGTKEDMARVMRECNEARQQIRPSVKILWPGMVNWDFTNPDQGFSNWAELATASDGAGGQARDHIQGIGHHTYPGSGTTADAICIYYMKVKKSCELMGKDGLPRYQTEFAFTNGTETTEANAARVYGQCYLMAAIYGYQFANPWSFDIGGYVGGSLKGNWGGHIPWVSGLFRNNHNAVAQLMGKQIRWAYVMNNNTIRCGTNDGLTVSV